MILASGIWYGILTYVAAQLLPRLDDVASLVVRMNWIGFAAILVIAGTGAAFFVLTRRRRAKTHSAESNE
jgi:hypothetical protein